MGAPETTFPDRTSQEGQALDEQIALLKQSREAITKMMQESDLLAPFLFQQAGYDVTQAGLGADAQKRLEELNGKLSGLRHQMQQLDPNDPERKAMEDEYQILSGERQRLTDQSRRITGISNRDAGLDDKRRQVAEGWLDRVIAAQRGELPVNPALLRDLREEEQTMGEIMRRSLGPDWQTSSPGSEALTKFGESRLIALDQARRGDMSQAEAASMMRGAESEAMRDNSLKRLFAISQRNMPGIGATLQTSAGYAAPLGQMFQDRQGQFQSRALNAQLDMQNRQMWTEFVSSLLGSAGSAAGMAAMSSARLKKHISAPVKGTALDKIEKTPVRRWRYKWESDDREPHIGPLLEESPKEIHYGDGTHVSLYDYLGLQHAAVQELSDRVTTLGEALRGKRRG